MARRLACLIAGVFALAAINPAFAQGAPAGQDAFYWLNEMNKASIVMLVETGIVPRPVGKQIANAVDTVIREGDADRTLRSGNYLDVEPLLIKAGGPDVTRIHSGRSRQDIGATARRLTQREAVLESLASLDAARGALLDFAARHPGAIVPAYTWGVQAQPVSFGHYVLAYTEALERDGARLRAAYATVNRSPFGSAALGTSSFPIDRPRLAQLLGFDGVITNSLDANQLSPIDMGADLAAIAASTALTVGTFVSDMEAQYRMSTPWITITEGNLTGISSIMPQKRNPVSLQMIRMSASGVVGDAMTFYMKAHNVTAGMGDYKDDQPEIALRNMRAMLDQLARVVAQLKLDEKRAQDEVDGDYSSTTELADILQRDANVPFRVGHHFASELVNYGRGAGLRPGQIPYAEARRIFARAATDFQLADTRFPLTEARFHEALSARNMVLSSKGLGGPQPAEVKRMMAEQRAQLADDASWLGGRREALAKARSVRDTAFDQLRSTP